MRYGRKCVHGRFASPDEECLCQTNHIQWHIASDSPLQPIKKVRKVDFERICSVSNKLMIFKDMRAQNKKICSGCLNYCLHADPIPLPRLPPMENYNIAPSPNAIVNEHLLSNVTQTNHAILVLDLTNEDSRYPHNTPDIFHLMQIHIYFHFLSLFVEKPLHLSLTVIHMLLSPIHISCYAGTWLV